MAKLIPMSRLRNKTEENLLKLLSEHKNELLKLRQQKVSGNVKPTDFTKERRNVARILTQIRHKRLVNAIKKYRNAKLLPKDMRPKKTRAQRLMLTEEQKNTLTWRERIRKRKYKKQYFAYVEPQQS
ncbi:ribosomal protein L29 [Edhazardia aedis USNM 41457]|uniref:Ribosomal protein L29 n=1 Tax=Edhazardia aedis (strain USNM 41457) TaxID=1003232 RepID=J9D732_EDHAE|nr:ribosomal protein L29 [Edhazardia aedis USNM 41457]|eukprot:EJW03576.1 ribosomal protein L29 [Edhazardia aedis USNM 41457]